MIYKILITQRAYDDLTNISNYINFNLYEPNTSERVLEKIDKKINSLRFMPHRFTKINNYKLGTTIRKCYSGNYVIIYSVDDSKRLVIILNIIYGKRDWINLI